MKYPYMDIVNICYVLEYQCRNIVDICSGISILLIYLINYQSLYIVNVCYGMTMYVYV